MEACEKLCAKRKRKRERESTQWLNEELQEARKKRMHLKRYALCEIRSEKDKNNYKQERNLTRKIVSKAMRIEAEQVMKDFCDKQNILFNLVEFIKKERTRCKQWTKFCGFKEGL